MKFEIEMLTVHIVQDFSDCLFFWSQTKHSSYNKMENVANSIPCGNSFPFGNDWKAI